MLGIVRVASALILLLGSARASFAQANPELRTYFRDFIGLSDDQIAAIRAGQATVKNLESRTPEEIFVFGAIYINAKPESYLKFSRDFDRLRKLPGYLALGKFSSPPQLSDLNGFTFDTEDIESLKKCKAGNCQIQMPTSSIEEVHQSVDLSAADAQTQVNTLLQKTMLERLVSYQREGNAALGQYNDKRDPTNVSEQFKYMLSYSRALPRYLPDFYNYLLTYPEGKPPTVEDTFYWANVKFGLKPTLRVVHVVTMSGQNDNEPAYTIAEKQLYSSHYFQTALDLTFCISDPPRAHQPGFYLIMAMGSEQAGLTGLKGSIVRKVAVDRSASSLRKSLTAIKSELEQRE